MNEILTSIANRSNGFENECLSTGQVFEPWAGSPDYLRLQGLFNVRPKDPEFSLVGLLMTVESFPEVKMAFGELVRTYNPSGVSPSSYYLTNGILMPDHNGPARVTRYAEEWPVNHEIHFVHLGNNQGIVYTDDRKDMVSVSTHDDFICPVWPAWSGVNGKIQSDVSSWTDFRCTITHNPINFPYQALADQLDASSDMRNALAREGLEVPYYYAGSNPEKVAVAALALGLSNKRVYPDA